MQEVLNARAAEAKYLQSLGSTAMVSALPYEEKLQKFVNTRVAHRMRPINYRPNGSFKELKVRLTRYPSSSLVRSPGIVSHHR